MWAWQQRHSQEQEVPCTSSARDTFQAERDQQVQVSCWLLQSLNQKWQHKVLCRCLWKTNLSWIQPDLKHAKGKQRAWRRCLEERRTTEKRKKIPKSLASELPEFIQFISTTTQKVKSANGLQSNATQSSALKIPFLGNSRKRRKSRNIATSSFRLPDLWLFETGASRAQEILDYSHFFQEAWKQTKHNSSRPAAGVKECKLLFQQQKKYNRYDSGLFSLKNSCRSCERKTKGWSAIPALHLIPTHTTCQTLGLWATSGKGTKERNYRGAF